MEITPQGLAALTGGTVVGDEAAVITGFAKIEEAKKGDLSFIANPKYAHYIHTTKATAVLVGKDFDPQGECNATLIKVDDPYATLAELLRMVESMKPQPVGIENPVYVADGVEIPENCYIGAFAYIGKGARLGKNVKIYPQSYVGEGVVIGDDTVIRAGVKIYEGCRIGARCIIHSGAVIGADGFGFAPNNGHFEKIPQTGIVVIADDVEIGANTTVDRATFGQTSIGRGTKLDNLIQVAHNVTIGEDNVFASQTGIAGSVHIGNGNMIAGQCGFAGHITVGDYNEIGAQSGIPKSVGSRQRLMGYPAVDARQFAKNQVYIKNLGKLFTEFNTIKK
ncbi:MAG: UDP-3-O-(3-hydroxymyristoyl)glucosamine N-acyltransferase [Muribaculaceae bacterium]|nr:UDP-3-O-(3-hydroxymyristoyl)glucosamine N-acyltransferase [Muribaculaceae bacterium]MDE6795275.1 UDP-3-O-(3-hydroxymyristoyl)glucosamine N-acyltransferase [Muribaculaceae bacterium]